MPFPDIDPVIFHIGSLPVRWYGLMYIIGFIVGYFIILRDARRTLGWDKDEVADLVFYMAMGVILGGRLGYIIFYNLPSYLQHPLDIFKVWEGGMSFHGGFIGIVIGAALFARKMKTRFMTLADICVPAGPIGLFLGRIGNFINGELYGRQTDVSWGIIFREGGRYPRHPSQLYEALLEGLAIFLILMLIKRKRPPEGVIFWSFIALYGFFRFFVEFFREPDQHIGFLFGFWSLGQLLSLPMLILGIFMVWRSIKTAKR
jgi:phosphatidylglycerol:prolipoprotein diacylglycerol transferase